MKTAEVIPVICCACAETFGDIRVPHKGDVVGQVIEGAYEVLGFFDKVIESRDEMKSITLDEDEQRIYAKHALGYKYDAHVPVAPEQVLLPNRRQDNRNDLWTTYQRVQENLIKGGLIGRTA